MNSGVNVAPTTFLKMMPIGWYRVEFQTVVTGSEDVETVRQLVMALEDQVSGYRRFFERLARADLSVINSEGATIADANPIMSD